MVKESIPRRLAKYLSSKLLWINYPFFTTQWHWTLRTPSPGVHTITNDSPSMSLDLLPQLLFLCSFQFCSFWGCRLNLDSQIYTFSPQLFSQKQTHQIANHHLASCWKQSSPHPDPFSSILSIKDTINHPWSHTSSLTFYCKTQSYFWRNTVLYMQLSSEDCQFPFMFPPRLIFSQSPLLNSTWLVLHSSLPTQSHITEVSKTGHGNSLLKNFRWLPLLNSFIKHKGLFTI